MANPPRLRVLFVEDEPALRLSYARFFRPKYEVAFAGTGAEAEALLPSWGPDVTVLDMRLPDTDGIDLLRRLRSLRPDLRVIVTTAYLSIEPQLRMLDLPFSGYFVKPFDLNELGDRINCLR